MYQQALPRPHSTLMGSPAMKKKKSGTTDGFEQLTLSDAGLCDVLKDRILETLQAEDNKFEDLQHDIRGNLYLVPNTVSWPMEMVKGPSTTEVPIHYALKIRRENGQVDDVIIQMEMVSSSGKWKLVKVTSPTDLDGNLYSFRHRIGFYVKKVGSEKWEPVTMQPRQGGKRWYYFPGTTFHDGDQLDMRFVLYDHLTDEEPLPTGTSAHVLGKNAPVSPDGTERTNLFPLTIRIMSPTQDQRPKKISYAAASIQYLRLAGVCRSMRQSYIDCTTTPAIAPMVARVLCFVRMKKEIGSCAFLKLQPRGNVVNQVIGPKKFELTMMFSAKLPQQRVEYNTLGNLENGYYIHRGLTFSWFLRNGQWMLQKNKYLSDPNLHLTIKRPGVSSSIRVLMFSRCHAQWREAPNGSRAMYTMPGTVFQDGDQLDAQYILDGVSHPVCFNAKEETNMFPVTFRVIQ